MTYPRDIKLSQVFNALQAVERCTDAVISYNVHKQLCNEAENLVIRYLDQECKVLTSK